MLRWPAPGPPESSHPDDFREEPEHMGLVTPDAPSDLGQLIRSLIHRQEAGGAILPDEGRLPRFEGATGWLNSEPLTPAGLRGRVILVDFWTYTCINWLRTL